MVPPRSHRVSRVRRYSGSPLNTLIFRLRDSHPVSLAFPHHSAKLCIRPQVRTPTILLQSVWPLPRSLATTDGISVDFFSSPYLDVSVQAVPRVWLFDSPYADRVLLCRVSPFGYLRISAYLQLPEAYRSLSRPSSAPDAKAFPLRSYQLDHALRWSSSRSARAVLPVNFPPYCIRKSRRTLCTPSIFFFVWRKISSATPRFSSVRLPTFCFDRPLTSSPIFL